IKKLVVGDVLWKRADRDGDKLNICEVELGEEEGVEIVCGGGNVDEEQEVIVGKVGGGLGGGIKIKGGKLGGEGCEGMI
ncbi:hypothetical protein, partial [Staphylococcus epidermidis]|uniref:hypothetical protein n=1 Tax=Staphylococcus epidermidis TaxID=1282 RepID=UPI00119EC600